MKPNPTCSSGRKECTNRNASTAMRAYVSEVTTHQIDAMALDTFWGSSTMATARPSKTVCMARLTEMKTSGRGCVFPQS